MLKMSIIGNLGRDAEVGQYNGEVVVNFSVAHTDKYKDGKGGFIQKTAWVRCSWWTDKQGIVQYLRTGQMVYVEGFPEAKMWDGKDGKKACGLTLRVISLQLVGGQRQENSNSPSDNQNQSGYTSAYANDDPPF